MDIIASNLVLADLLRGYGPGVKKDIVGVVTALEAAAYPANLSGLWFIWLATVRAPAGTDADLELCVRRADGGEAASILQVKINIATATLGGAVEVAGAIPMLTLLAPGVRVFEMLYQGRVIASAALAVGQVNT